MNIDLAQFWHFITAHVTVIRREGDHAVVECPLGHTDAWLHLNARPMFMHCLHGKCQDDIRAWNLAFAEAQAETFGDEEFGPCAADPKQEAERKRLYGVQCVAHSILPRLIEQGPVSDADWLRRSPYDLSKVPVENHWRLLLELYRPYVNKLHDHIWCGQLRESGGPGFAWNFKTLDGWLAEDTCPGPQTCLCLFGSHYNPIHKEGGSIQRHGSRGGKWCKFSPWLVLESDDIPLEEFGQVLRFAAEKLNLRLKAIVDSGKKSAHGWFLRPQPPDESAHTKAVDAAFPSDMYGDDSERTPNPRYTRELRSQHIMAWDAAWKKDQKAKARFEREQAEWMATLRGLTCDPKLWRTNSTARLPGCVRLDDRNGGTGEPILDAHGQPRWQRLIYYNPEA